MAMLAILAACHKYFACGNKVLFCSVPREEGRIITDDFVGSGQQKLSKYR